MQKLGSILICNIPYAIVLYENEFEKINMNLRERNDRYTIDKDEEEKKSNVDGYCDYSSKEIHIFRDHLTSKHYFKQTLTHEITHAFLYEIGYAHHDDEEFVDKLSKWVPQIQDIVTEGLEVIKDAKSFKEFKGKK